MVTDQKCRGCGSTNFSITNSREGRVRKCLQCGRVEQLPMDEGMRFSHSNAIDFLVRGMLTTAVQYAREAINSVPGDIPAFYIISFHADYSLKQNGSLREFFQYAQTRGLAPGEPDELMALFRATGEYVMEYEEEILRLLIHDPQTDRQRLGEFADAFCSAQIANRPSAGFLTEEMVSYYSFLAGTCGAYKPCYALVNAIWKNSGSPFCRDTFFQEKRTRLFYERFVLPVGKIIGTIPDPSCREKCENAYREIKQKYERRAGYQPG